MKKFLPKTLNNPQGFTLVELMVVITIIAFLAVIGIVSFTNIQAQARDGRRRADIDAIATAMEANRDPVAGTYKAYSDTSIYANGVLPSDPINATYNSLAYGYVVTGGAAGSTAYVACARLEKGNGNSSSGTSMTPSGTLNFYCRANQQ